MRIKRMPGTPHSIAAGIASGAAVSCTPLVGFHFLLGFALAFVLRGNMLAAALGTAFGNPWTFPFLWTVSYQVGIHLIWIERPGEFVVEKVSWSNIFENFNDFFLPAILGAIPFGAIIFLVVYVVFRHVIATAQAKRRQLREKALQRRRDALAEGTDSSRLA